MLRKRSRRVSTNAAAISSPVQMPWKRFWNFVKPLRMQLVRTAQPKHKINLLSLSTEAGGPDVGHLVCSINSMQFVRTAQFKHKHLLALYSHSPRRTGGPQAPASGALVMNIIKLTVESTRRDVRLSIITSSSGLWCTILYCIHLCRREIGSTPGTQLQIICINYLGNLYSSEYNRLIQQKTKMPSGIR